MPKKVRSFPLSDLWMFSVPFRCLFFSCLAISPNFCNIEMKVTYQSWLEWWEQRRVIAGFGLEELCKQHFGRNVRWENIRLKRDVSLFSFGKRVTWKHRFIHKARKEPMGLSCLVACSLWNLASESQSELSGACLPTTLLLVVHTNTPKRPFLPTWRSQQRTHLHHFFPGVQAFNSACYLCGYFHILLFPVQRATTSPNTSLC